MAVSNGLLSHRERDAAWRSTHFPQHDRSYHESNPRFLRPILRGDRRLGSNLRQPRNQVRGCANRLDVFVDVAIDYATGAVCCNPPPSEQLSFFGRHTDFTRLN
jgi:hypothetical protein